MARRQRESAPRGSPPPLAAADRRTLAEAFMLQYVLWHAEIDAHADVRVPICAKIKDGSRRRRGYNVDGSWATAAG